MVAEHAQANLDMRCHRLRADRLVTARYAHRIHALQDHAETLYATLSELGI